jgi:hypothetical protein
MNDVYLKGLIKNIQPSHSIEDVEYNKADFIVKRQDGKEDILNLRFKKYSLPYKEDQEIELVGNIRSYSKKVGDKNKIDIYVFTYFDKPEIIENVDNGQTDVKNNVVTIDGRICKIDGLRKTQAGKRNIHFILANNLCLKDTDKKLNSYIPCVAWGKLAKEISELSVNDKVKLIGELHSREYKKKLSEDDFEIRVAHEFVVNSIEKLD